MKTRVQRGFFIVTGYCRHTDIAECALLPVKAAIHGKCTIDKSIISIANMPQVGGKDVFSAKNSQHIRLRNRSGNMVPPAIVILQIPPVLCLDMILESDVLVLAKAQWNRRYRRSSFAPDNWHPIVNVAPEYGHRQYLTAIILNNPSSAALRFRVPMDIKHIEESASCRAFGSCHLLQIPTDKIFFLRRQKRFVMSRSLASRNWQRQR